MLAKNLTLHCPFCLSYFAFSLPVLTHNVGLGGMTGSHSVGPQVNTKAFVLAWGRYSPTVHSQNTSVLLAALENRKSLPLHPFGTLCRSIPPRNQIPSIPVVCCLLPCNQLTHVSFLSLILSRMGEPGDAAVPLKQTWRWRSEASEFPLWAEPELGINKT